MAMDRRTFLHRAAATGGVVAAGPFLGFVNAAGAEEGLTQIAGYGPIGPVADQLDGKVRLDLPAGFNYRTFHHAGTEMVSGEATLPGRHDGMGAFPGSTPGSVILVRNHEVNGPVTAMGKPGKSYDRKTGGGTISVEVDGEGNVLNDWISLSGTQMNCSGGKTPWGSWISGEETVNGDDVGNDFTGQSNLGLQKHGYIFEVPADGKARGNPIRHAGRFAHEAIVVDPDSGYLYMTEDNFNFASGFYRYIAPGNPNRYKRVIDGGTLQMLKVVGVDNADLSVEQAAGAEYSVEWVDIKKPNPKHRKGTTNDEAIVAVGDQGRALGAAIFSRLEGATFHEGEAYFVSTQGGPTAEGDSAPSGFGDGRGQVWAYRPATGTLRLVYQSPSSALLDLPDNVTASSTGALVLCEDGSGDNFLRGLTPHGEIFDFARNADADQVGQEFAGAAFSPDYSTLYVNVQSGSGYSVAIWGPWDNGAFGVMTEPEVNT